MEARETTSELMVGAYRTLVDEGLAPSHFTSRALLIEQLARARYKKPWEAGRIMNFLAQGRFDDLRFEWMRSIEATTTERFSFAEEISSPVSKVTSLVDSRAGSEMIMNILRSSLGWRRDSDYPRITKTVHGKGPPSWHIEVERESNGIPGLPARSRESATLRFEGDLLVLAHESGTALCLPPGRVHIPRDLTLETLPNLVVYLLVGDRVSSTAPRTVEQYVFTKLGRTLVEGILRRGLGDHFAIWFDQETARPTWRVHGKGNWSIVFLGDTVSASSSQGFRTEAEPSAFWKRMESLGDAMERRIIPAIDPSFENDLDRVGRLRRFVFRSLNGT